MGGEAWVMFTSVSRFTRYELCLDLFSARGQERCRRCGFGRSVISSIASAVFSASL